jgi:endonuclease/exonuclease/phosphatase family metal-dependent hydrolase
MVLKVISLNMWWGGHLFPQLLGFLKSEDADVILLQEVYDSREPDLPQNYHSMAVLQAKLNYPQNIFAQAYLEKKDNYLIPHGNAIVTKLPVKEFTQSFMTEPTKSYYQDTPEYWPIMPALLQHAQLEAGGQEVNFYNMHGVWDMDGDNYSQRRQQMVEVILSQTKNKPNVILAGDSNAKPTNPAMRNLEKQLKPVFGSDLKTTFNMRRKDNPGYATAAVDLMYTSPDMKVLSRDCPDIDISDHLPLVVRLDIT